MDAKKVERYTAEDYFNLPEDTRVELIMQEKALGFL